MALTFNDSNFQNEVLNSDKPVLVDFWAEWCGPCRMIAPVVEELSSEYSGKAVIGKVNVDENPGISGQFGIRSIPTLLIFKGGKVVDKLVGALPKSHIAAKIEAHL
ncbi:MAG: thioredoxin [Bacteroidetes bacterium]|nr:thioredoxin [Bacteroidota bacterium]